MEPARIEEISERVAEFVKALRAAGAREPAQRIEGYARAFTDATGVRRAVASIHQQLEYWRVSKEELPDLPVVRIAANRLEDVCKDALQAGVIEPARLSVGAQTKRTLRVVVATLAAGGLLFLVPLVLVVLGFDPADLMTPRQTATITLPQGEESSVTVNVLVESAQPSITRGVEIYVKGRCNGDMAQGASCKKADPRHWPQGPLDTFEFLLPDQAYGLLIAFTEQQVTGKVGSALVLLAASEDTPEGSYRIPLEAAFSGYRPARCNLLDRVRGTCEPARTGPSEKHEGLRAETVVVEVVRADPLRGAGERRRKEAEAAEKRRKAEERAAGLARVLSEIKSVLDDTKKLLQRKRHEDARERIEKLAQLFAPIAALAAREADEAELPIEVEELRAHFHDLQRELTGFEDRAYERAFAVLTAPENRKRAEAELVAEVSHGLRISAAYLESIYTARAAETQRRLERASAERADKERAAKEALERRCGPLPTGAFKEVEAYLRAMARAVRVKTKMGECLTPRLGEERCWTVVCDFQEIVATAESVPDVVKSHQWTFVLRGGRVVGHEERAPLD